MEPMIATLLLVDDEAMNRDALSRRLIRSGYSVLVAEHGQQALDMIAAHHVDLVLLDVMMPGLNGIETLRRLRQCRSIAELPVIMVTANSDPDDVVNALDLGANDYISKPVDYAIALARIRTQLTARRADPLTGLPNRVLFMERLTERLARSAAIQAYDFSVLFLDVDRFKIINDSLGHLAGDELLVSIARRLAHSLRSTDTVSRLGRDATTLARLGGDEFIVLLDGTKRVGDARKVAERLVAAVSEPFELEGRDVAVTVSIGAVMAAERYTRALDMIRDADTAMYRAKDLGKARCEFFDTSMLALVEERLQLESDLRRAVDRQELVLHYQPIVALAGAELCGFEALVRWRHPTRGLISPEAFIPIAEETGLILPIGLWVLREACRQMRVWEAEFPECSSLMLNVNLSVKQCLAPRLVEQVAGILRDTGYPAERLKLEITESLVLENPDRASEILHALRRLGVQLGLDDFGTGYSGLTHLQRLPVQTLKIDRSFVDGIQRSENVEIIRAIVSLAAGLAMNVTAEGVETADQAARLRELACEFGQGFYFHKPLSQERAEAVLREREWPIATTPQPLGAHST